jgi:hypothetical protein
VIPWDDFSLIHRFSFSLLFVFVIDIFPRSSAHYLYCRFLFLSSSFLRLSFLVWFTALAVTSFGSGAGWSLRMRSLG